MKLARIGPAGEEQPAVLADDGTPLVLRPGDIINTGTPAGVALGRPEGGYLRPGDTMRLEIDGLGTQQQTLGSA